MWSGSCGFRWLDTVEVACDRGAGLDGEGLSVYAVVSVQACATDTGVASRLTTVHRTQLPAGLDAASQYEVTEHCRDAQDGKLVRSFWAKSVRNLRVGGAADVLAPISVVNERWRKEREDSIRNADPWRREAPQH